MGYWIDAALFGIGLSERRAAWMANWLKEVVAEGKSLAGSIAAVLGRLSFAANAIEEVKPFLGPVDAFAAAVPPHALLELPDTIRIIFEYLRIIFEDKLLYRTRAKNAVGGAASIRADAKAEGLTVAVGVWKVPQNGNTLQAEWYGLTLSKTNAP